MDETTKASGQFKDRRVGLIIFGIILIGSGILVALMIPVMILGLLMSGHLPGTEPIPLRVALPSFLLYTGLAVTFVWLGIGSLKCCRWARALVLLLSWGWLIAGIISFGMNAFMLPRMVGHVPGTPEIPEAVKNIVTLVTVSMVGLFGIVMPGSLVAFYGSRNVRETCWSRDPVTRWTDSFPLPLLAVTLILALGAVTMVLMIPTYNGVVPLFGTYVSGVPGAGILLVVALAYAFAARECFHRRLVGWWAAVALYLIGGISSFTTFMTVGLLPMYQRMGLSELQLARITETGISNQPWFMGFMFVSWIAYLGFVVFTKRYFSKPISPT